MLGHLGPSVQQQYVSGRRVRVTDAVDGAEVDFHLRIQRVEARHRGQQDVVSQLRVGGHGQRAAGSLGRALQAALRLGQVFHFAQQRAAAQSAGGLRALALWWGGPMWSTWGDLAYSVRNGASARAMRTGHAHDDGFMDESPALAGFFHEAMRTITQLVAGDVARLALWSEVCSVVDVGGGHGDIFIDVPPDADCYLLKRILHNWRDEDCHRILTCCARAALPGARLLLIERVRNVPLQAHPRDRALARTDLNMLVGLGGRERTRAEFTALLAATGFQVTTSSPTHHEFDVVEARRV
jgi:O-methyltransferase domain